MLSSAEGLRRAQAKALSLGGECLSTEWKRTRSIYRWKCKNGHIWNSSYDRVVRSNPNWCKECIKLPPSVGWGRLVEFTNVKNLKLLSESWLGGNGKYNVKCLVCNYEFKSFYAEIVRRKSRGCIKCSARNTAISNTYTEDEIKVELLKMGIEINSNFKYQGLYEIISGMSFKGRPFKAKFSYIKACFRKTGIPRGMSHSSAEDSWIGFVCSLASCTSLYLNRPEFLEGLSFDMWDPSVKKAIEFNGPRHDLGGSFKDHPDTIKVVERDLKKVKLAEKFGIDLKVFHWKGYPKDRLEQSKLILNHMYPNRFEKVFNKLLAMQQTDSLNLEYLNWCDKENLLNRKRRFQEDVCQDLLKNGIPIRGSRAYYRFATVVTPKGYNFDKNVREIAIGLGYSSIERRRNTPLRGEGKNAG